MMRVIGAEEDNNYDDDDDAGDGDHDPGKVCVWVQNGLMTRAAATLVSCPPSFLSSHHQHCPQLHQHQHQHNQSQHHHHRHIHIQQHSHHHLFWLVMILVMQTKILIVRQMVGVSQAVDHLSLTSTNTFTKTTIQ